jgi:hypothetical protein
MSLSLEQSMMKRYESNNTISNDKDGVKKQTSEVIKNSSNDMREMGEVIRELTVLVMNIV